MEDLICIIVFDHFVMKLQLAMPILTLKDLGLSTICAPTLWHIVFTSLKYDA